MHIGICQINTTIGAIAENAAAIIENIEWAKGRCNLVIFSELALCGYFPDDLLLNSHCIEAQKKALDMIVTASKGIAVVLGLVRREPPLGGGKFLRNSCAVIIDGKLAGFQDKMLLPTYDVFDERRYFEPSNEQKIWEIAGKKVGITICEDIWHFTAQVYQEHYFVDPVVYFEKKGIDLLINISASPYSIVGEVSRWKIRQELLKTVARRLKTPVILCNQVGAQDGLIFDGASMAVSQDGTLIYRAKSFEEERSVLDLDSHQAVQLPATSIPSELFAALSLGVRDYFAKQGFTKACIGLSGGIDSSVAASIAVHALGREHVLGLLLPSRYTAQESVEDARALAYNLGIETQELSIEPLFERALTSLKPLFEGMPQDSTEENLQSRIRGMLLMALCNKKGYILLNTGNKSEIAMGYFTLYGDGCGAIAVLGDLLKYQVYDVGRWIGRTWGWIPERVFERPPTAELAFDQKDSDTLPEYPMLDVIVNEHIVHNMSAASIAEKYDFTFHDVQAIVQKIYRNEYKRRQIPFALRVSEKAFSCGRKVPIVQRFFY